MEKSFIEDDDLYNPEEEMEDEVEELDFDIFGEEDEELESISSYWNDRDEEDSGYNKKRKSSRYSYDSDY